LWLATEKSEDFSGLKETNYFLKRKQKMAEDSLSPCVPERIVRYLSNFKSLKGFIRTLYQPEDVNKLKSSLIIFNIIDNMFGPH
jgi:hypothetical protein